MKRKIGEEMDREKRADNFNKKIFHIINYIWDSNYKLFSLCYSSKFNDKISDV